MQVSASRRACEIPNTFHRLPWNSIWRGALARRFADATLRGKPLQCGARSCGGRRWSQRASPLTRSSRIINNHHQTGVGKQGGPHLPQLRAAEPSKVRAAINFSEWFEEALVPGPHTHTPFLFFLSLFWGLHHFLPLFWVRSIKRWRCLQVPAVPITASC